MLNLAQLSIFPCNLAKEPLSVHGFKSARSGAKWKGWPLVGFATGRASGIDVLDIDPSGRKWFDQNFSALPTTRAHETQRGLHLFFKHADGLNCSTNKIAEGLDVRADGGYAIWWPATGLPVDDHPICEWPDWLLAEAMGRSRRAGLVVQGPYERLSAHHHHGNWAATLNPNVRIARLMYKLETERPGNRNALLNWTAYTFGRILVEGFIKTRRDAEWLLQSAACANGLWRDDGAEQCKATIKSGLDAGMRAQREMILSMGPVQPSPTPQPRSKRKLKGMTSALSEVANTEEN
jgi:hypothetical protein